jgi:hypothetical protein
MFGDEIKLKPKDESLIHIKNPGFNSVDKTFMNRMLRDSLKSGLCGLWLALAAVIVTSVQACAWGDVGHWAVADIAVSRLSDKAKAEIARVLPGGLPDFVEIANWADEIIEEWPESYDWHSVDIPHDSTGYQRDRDCPNDNCIVERINLFARDVGNRGLPNEARAIALMMLIHLVGDLHMPLHAYQPDRSWEGWEGPWIRIEDDVDVLHYWWDNWLILELGANPWEIAREAMQDRSADEIQAWTESTPADWANESFFIARDFVIRHDLMDVARWVTLTDEYPMLMPATVRDEARPIIARRIAMAGVRLAAVLNRVLD